MKGKHFYVYILECSDGSYYTGLTNSLGNRMKVTTPAGEPFILRLVCLSSWSTRNSSVSDGRRKAVNTNSKTGLVSRRRHSSKVIWSY